MIRQTKIQQRLLIITNKIRLYTTGYLRNFARILVYFIRGGYVFFFNTYERIVEFFKKITLIFAFVFIVTATDRNALGRNSSIA